MPDTVMSPLVDSGNNSAIIADSKATSICSMLQSRSVWFHHICEYEPIINHTYARPNMSCLMLKLTKEGEGKANIMVSLCLSTFYL